MNFSLVGLTGQESEHRGRDMMEANLGVGEGARRKRIVSWWRSKTVSKK